MIGYCLPCLGIAFGFDIAFWGKISVMICCLHLDREIGTLWRLLGFGAWSGIWAYRVILENLHFFFFFSVPVLPYSMFWLMISLDRQAEFVAFGAWLDPFIYLLDRSIHVEPQVLIAVIDSLL